MNVIDEIPEAKYVELVEGFWSRPVKDLKISTPEFMITSAREDILKLILIIKKLSK